MAAGQRDRAGAPGGEKLPARAGACKHRGADPSAARAGKIFSPSLYSDALQTYHPRAFVPCPGAVTPVIPRTTDYYDQETFDRIKACADTRETPFLVVDTPTVGHQYDDLVAAFPSVTVP